MLSVSLKTLNIIFMCFDGENNDLKKKKQANKRTYSNSNNKIISEVLKFDFVLSDDEIQFLRSLANSNFGYYCSRSALLINLSILRAQ